MTDYNIEFKDHRVVNPNRFKMVTVSPGVVDLVPIWIEDPSQIIEEGTPVNADLFEKLRANVTRRSETFAATAGQTIFNLTKAYIVDQGRLDVYISGVKQRSGIDFIETSPTSFTLSEGLEAGEIVEAVYFSASQALSEDLIEQVQAAEAATIAANDAADDANDAAAGALTANLTWKEPVDNLTALNALASPQKGDTRQTKDTGYVYRYTGTDWSHIQTMDPNAINALDTRLTSQLADTATEIDRIDSALLDDFELFELNYPESPANFPSIKPSFRVYRDVDNVIKHDFDFDSLEVGAGHIYVQGYGGSDSNDGLTSGTPVSTLGVALTKANALAQSTVVVHFLENAYDDSRFNPYQFTLTKNIVFKSDSSRGKTFFHGGTRPTSITWTADGSAYSCTRSAASKVFDTAIQYGDLPKEYTKVNSVAEVQATPGTWYTDGTSVWVRRVGDIVPDKDIAITLLRGIGIKFDIGANVFVTRDMEFYVETNVDDALSIHSTGVGEYWNENCVYTASLSRNGLAIMDVIKTYSFGSVALGNYLDGFNYHAPSILVSNKHYAFEFACKGFNNGTSAVTNANATTAHDGFAILRINGEYHDTHGPVLADVNGCFSVQYDCVAYNSLRPAGTAKAAFYFDNSSAVKDGAAYLINCAGGGNETDSIATYGIPTHIHRHKGKKITGTGVVSIV